MSQPDPASSSGKPAGQDHASGDLELVARVQSGDVSAFDHLVERYKGRLYGVIYNMTGNHEDAADLSQETFLRAFKAVGSFQKKANFYTWLYRIGINTTINFLKSRQEGHLSLNELDPQVEDEPVFRELTIRGGVGDAMDREKLQEKLNEALQKLSKQHRAIVVLHDIEGMKHQEIARVLGCSEATARTRLFYAHQKLQALLAKYL